MPSRHHRSLTPVHGAPVIPEAAVKMEPPALGPTDSTVGERAIAAGLAIASWALVGGITIAGTALLVDGSLLVAADAPPRLALGGTLMAAGLGGLGALALAPFLVAFASFARSGRRPLVWTVAVGAVGLGVGLAITGRAFDSNGAKWWVASAAFAFFVGAAYALARQNGRPRATATAILLATIALVLDVLVPPSLYRELHELAGIGAVAALLAAASPLQQRARRLPPASLIVGASLVALAACAAVVGVERVVPEWRVMASASGLWAARFSRLVRAVEPSVESWSAGALAGVSGAPSTVVATPGSAGTPLTPTLDSEAARGLTAPAGDPDLAPGEADLVVLITIDCLRASALTPVNAPRIWALAQRGLLLSRNYAGATNTIDSTILLQRGYDQARPLPMKLHAAGVTSTAIMPVRPPVPTMFRGFDRLLVPGTERWDAAATGNRASADLDLHDEPHYLWVHFIDTHAPYGAPNSVSDATLISDSATSMRYYLRALRVVDNEVGRLVDQLAASKRLARTVLIVTGDHGEGFGEHGVSFHIVSGWEAVTRVPTVVVAPGLAPSTYAGLSSHRDLPATILGAFGQVHRDRDAERFGRSLLRLRAAPDAPLHRFVAVRSSSFASGAVTHSPILALVEGRYKLVDQIGEGLLSLYDVEADPEERIDLATREAAVTSSLTGHAAQFLAQDRWSSAAMNFGD